MPKTSTCWLPKPQFNLALEQNVLFQKTLIQLGLYFAMPWQDEGQPLPCPRRQHTLSWGVGAHRAQHPSPRLTGGSVNPSPGIALTLLPAITSSTQCLPRSSPNTTPTAELGFK